MFFHLYRVYCSCTQKATPTQTGVIDRKKKRILATVDDSGASVSDSFSEYKAAKS